MEFKHFILPSHLEKYKLPFLQAFSFGWGNGYVCIPEGHPFYGKDYDYIDEFVDVHGGLTFASSSSAWAGHLATYDIFLEGNYWIIGFDTMHSGDGPHQDKAWVEAETLRLLEQIKEITGTLDDAIKGIKEQL